MLVLGIESTCDETACALVRGGRNILSNVVASQIDLHREYGGVVPELACRRHVDAMIPVIDQALQQANVTLEEVDLIAVAHGPGLVGALLLGINAAKSLSLALNKPLVGVNHIEAHLYAAMMSTQQEISFPCLGAILSGGHTALVVIHAIGQYQLIGQTVDDAIGEAFDKVAKILGLPYPGGPQIEKLAKTGNPQRYSFKAGQVKGQPLAFSFSGLKTSVLYTLKGQNAALEKTISLEDLPDICASFQHAALNDVVYKTLAAAAQYSCTSIVFGGGVVNNQRLRAMFNETNPHLSYYWPSLDLSLDNAAMIAGLGFHIFKQKGASDAMNVVPLTRIPFA